MMTPPYPKPAHEPVETLHVAVTTKFSFADSLRVLFGRKAHVRLRYNIWIVPAPDAAGEDARPGVVIEEVPAYSWVEALFPKKPSGEFAVMAPDEPKKIENPK